MTYRDNTLGRCDIPRVLALPKPGRSANSYVNPQS
jgi:hypothetical protein